MQGAFDLAVCALGSVAGVHVHSAQNRRHIALPVLFAPVAADDIGALETRLVAGIEAEVLLGRILHEVLALDIDLAGKHGFVRAHFGMVRMVFHIQLVTLVRGPVGQDHLQGPEHGHGTRRLFAQVLAHAVLQQGQINGAVGLGHADAVDEIADALRRIAPAAHRAQRGHAGIVPAGYVAALHQHAQIPLGHDGAGQVQAAELDLAGTGGQHVGRMLHHPVIQGAVILILQRAQAVGDALQRIADGMGEVIHGVDAPRLARAVMLLEEDAVHGRVAHVDVGAGHVDLHAQDHAALGMLARFHLLKQTQAFLHGAVPIGAVPARLGEGAAVEAHLFGREFTHVGEPALDPVHGDIIALLIVLTGEKQPALPVESQPADVGHDAVHVFRLFLGGVGIVKAQVGHAAEVLGGQKISHQCLAMSDVQVTVGFRGKARVHALIAPAP